MDRDVQPRRAASKRTPASAQSRRKWLRHALVFVTVLLVVNAFAGERGLFETWRVEREFRQLSASLADVRRQNAELRDRAQRLKHDPRAIEEAARRDLGLMRPGELVFIVKDVAPPKSSEEKRGR